MSVIVTGMHRSGTSAAARVVSLLGLPVCTPETLLRGHHGNERGHWECAPLVAENDRMLASLAARWWCPPSGLGPVAALADDEVRAATARAAFVASHPGRTWVWKDPRLCLLLPFWRRVLPRPPAAVLLVSRDPVRVAASMLARDRISPQFGLAVWERHVRLAIEGAQGLPLLVTNHRDLLADPVAWVRRAAGFLRESGVDARVPADPAGIRGFLGAARESRAGGAGEGESLTPAQRELWTWLRDCGRSGPSVPAPPPADDGGAVALLEEVREAFGLGEGAPRPAAGHFVSTTGVRVLEPPAAIRTRSLPGISVLLLPRGRAATLEEARRLRPRLPDDAEIITIADTDEGERPPDALPDWFTIAGRGSATSLAQRLNVGVRLARGRLLAVLAGPSVTPLPGWLPPLRSALEDTDCAVAAPAIDSVDGDGPAYGLAPSSHLLSADWIVTAPDGERPFAVPAVSIAAMVIRRSALDAIGGFDPGMAGAGCEDVELCLRLWRVGWRCVAVPRARVRMRFETLPAGDVDVLANTLRLAAVHLDTTRFAELLGLVAANGSFPQALARVQAGGVGRRRKVVDALSWYETAGLPACLGVALTDGAQDCPSGTLTAAGTDGAR